jgi:hypothetical protein
MAAVGRAAEKHPHDQAPHRHHRHAAKDNLMTPPDTQFRDDAADALAIVLACLDQDEEAHKTIAAACEPAGVLAILAGMVTGALVEDYGEVGARAFINRAQRKLDRGGA